MPRWFIRSERKPRVGGGKFKVYQPWWIDPHWFIVGSSIEKMVMAELVRRNMYFIYRAQTNNLGGFVDPSWEADFLLPHHKVWVEVQGSYWHSKPGAIERDSLRYAAIEMAGWTPIFLWEWDIRVRLVDLLDQYPVFRAARLDVEANARKKYGTNKGLSFGLGAEDLVDQLVGLRKANANRTRPPQLKVKRKLKRRPKI